MLSIRPMAALTSRPHGASHTKPFPTYQCSAPTTGSGRAHARSTRTLHGGASGSPAPSRRHATATKYSLGGRSLPSLAHQRAARRRRPGVVRGSATGIVQEASAKEGLQLNECERRAWELVRELQSARGPDGQVGAKEGNRAVLGVLLQWGKGLGLSRPAGNGAPAVDGRGLRARENRLMGCTAHVWADVSVGLRDGTPVAHLLMDSDAGVTRGLCAVLERVLNGAEAEAVLAMPADSPALQALTGLLGPAIAGPARANGLPSMLLSIQKRTRRQLAQPGTRAAELAVESLPSILIASDGAISAQGEFAVSQAKYLNPDPRAVDALVEELSRKRVGVVAHFYMDPEVQGVLVAAQKKWPHIAISDSLVMADRALTMVREGGCSTVTVLGVDFMAENVRAVLEKGGMGHVPVLRMAPSQIGCSLADAARSPAYLAYLDEAAGVPHSLHVIYINTALDTKAHAQQRLPTITCTSSNVLQTVLQTFAQVPNATVWFGPDTYMGGNLVEMLHRLSTLPEADVRALHPQHTPQSLAALVRRVRYFQEGACIVHDMFGSEVVRQLRTAYSDAYHTAHFEVPGEMFALAMEARTRGRGTVGSTQNILDFIVERTREAVQRGFDERLQFVLGTESGMVTAIVTAVRRELAAALAAVPAGNPRPNIEVEIVFPVNSAAITATEKRGGESDPVAGTVAASLAGALRVVPGAATGEGCSFEGGCASCPYMKMNSLDALMSVLGMLGRPDSASLLAAYEPDKFLRPEMAGPGSSMPAVTKDGSAETATTVADLGYLPILHMRHFQKNGSFSSDLVEDIQTRWQKLHSSGVKAH